VNGNSLIKCVYTVLKEDAKKQYLLCW